MIFLRELRLTTVLALPMIAGHLVHMLMGWVDILMIGRVGVVPLAACGFANAVMGIPFLAGIGLLTAIGVRASIAHGAGDEEGRKRSFFAGIIFSTIVGVVVAIVLCVLVFFLHIFRQPEEVIAEVKPYFIICSISMIPAMISVGGKSFSEALARPWVPFLILIGTIALNALLNWVFIFGNWGAPAMGLTGAGWATLIARVVSLAALWVALGVMFRMRFRRGGLRTEMRKQFRLGTPVGIAFFAENFGFSAASIMMGWIGVTALAAHQIVVLCAATAFMIPLGLSQAACVRIGHARGEGTLERCRPIVFGVVALTVLVMLGFTLLFTMWGDVLASRFSEDEALVALTAALLVFVGVMEVFDGLQVVFCGVLRAFEDVRTPMVVMIAVYWIVALPVAYVLAFKKDFGPQGVWAGITLGIAIAAIALGLRTWRRIKN